MPSATLHESAQFEPDDGWKLLLKVQIEANMKDMVDRVRANYNKQVEEDPSNDGQWSKDCQAALKDLSRLAKKQFKTGVDRERNQRRWAAGIGVEERVLREQNEASFKQTESKWGHEVSSTHASDTPGPLAQDLPSELPIITSEAPSPPPMTVFRPSPPPLAPTEPERPFRLTTSIPTNKKPALKKGPVELSTSARSRDNYSGTIRRTKLAVEEVEGNKLPPRSPRAVIGRSASTVRLPGTITQALLGQTMNTTDIRSNGSAYSVASGQPPMTPECPGELHEDICRINEEEKRGGMKREEQLNREEAERLQREEVAEIPQLSREEKERKDRQRNERERAARDRRGREDEARRETERNAAEEEVKRGKLRRLEEQRSARLKPLDSTVNPLDARIKPLDGRTLKSLDGRMTPLGKYRLWTKILEDAKKDFERFKQEEEERRENVRKQRKHEERHRSTLRHQEIWLWRQRQDGTEGAYTLPNFTEKRFIWVGFEERKERSKQEKMEEKEKEAQELFEMFKRLREENLEQLRRRRDDALRSPIDLEQSRLEMRCAMVVKLHEVWLEMDLELEREVCKQRTSWMKQKGQEKDDDDQVCMKSITAMEDCLRQEHVKAVEKLRLNMQRSVEKEIERQAKTVSFTERDDPQTAENLHQPSKAAVQSEDHASLDQDLKDLFDTDERGDNLEGRAAEQTPLSSTSNELEGACTNLSERVLELLPPAATDQQVLATQTAEDILEQENQLSLEALPGSNDLTSDSKSKSKEGRICPSSPSQSSPSDDRVLPSDSRLPSGASAGLRLDPDSLGISGIPPPSSFHTSQYTQSTTDTGDAAQEAHSSKASAGPLRPGGKANFLDSENVQVNGGTFVAASTVITNNYYVTHFQSTPLPPPRSSNRGSMRPYSTYL